MLQTVCITDAIANSTATKPATTTITISTPNATADINKIPTIRTSNTMTIIYDTITITIIITITIKVAIV